MPAQSSISNRCPGYLRLRPVLAVTACLWLVAAAVPSLAQQPDSPLVIERACRQDRQQFCPDIGRRGGVVAACLRQYYVNLSHACRAALRGSPAPSVPGDGTPH